MYSSLVKKYPWVEMGRAVLLFTLSPVFILAILVSENLPVIKEYYKNCLKVFKSGLPNS